MVQQKKQLSELTLEELRVREKALKTSNAVMLGLITVMFAVGIFITIRRGFSIFTVMPFIFLINVFVSIPNLKKIQAEISSRV